jgi:hypothetical protein
MGWDVFHIWILFEIMHMLLHIAKLNGLFFSFVPTRMLQCTQYKIFIADDFRFVIWNVNASMWSSSSWYAIKTSHLGQYRQCLLIVVGYLGRTWMNKGTLRTNVFPEQFGQLENLTSLYGSG